MPALQFSLEDSGPSSGGRAFVREGLGTEVCTSPTELIKVPDKHSKVYRNDDMLHSVEKDRRGPCLFNSSEVAMGTKSETEAQGQAPGGKAGCSPKTGHPQQLQVRAKVASAAPSLCMSSILCTHVCDVLFPEHRMLDSMKQTLFYQSY